MESESVYTSLVEPPEDYIARKFCDQNQHSSILYLE